jgi:hypothetical protein
MGEGGRKTRTSQPCRNTPEALSHYILPTRPLGLFVKEQYFQSEGTPRPLRDPPGKLHKGAADRIQGAGRPGRKPHPANRHQVPELLLENIRGLKQVLTEEQYKTHAELQLHTIIKISEHISEIKSNVMKMIGERKVANAMEDSAQKALAYCHDHQTPAGHHPLPHRQAGDSGGGPDVALAEVPGNAVYQIRLQKFGING